jgi:putative phage-type endonuclease
MTLSASQLAARSARLGGSDTAAALGMSRYKTAYQLYLEKRGEVPPSFEETNAIRMGRLLEPVVRQVYADDTGYIVRAPDTLYHAKYDWMVAHIDGVVAEHNRGWEGKSCAVPNFDEWGEEGSDEVPQEYSLQVQKYLIVTGLPTWDLSVITGRFTVRHYTIHADPELQQMIIEGEAEFIERMRSGKPPSLDYEHRSALDLIRKLYPGTNGKRMEASDEIIAARAKLDAAKETIKIAEGIVDSMKARLLDFMGESALLAFPDDGKCYRRKLTQRAGYTVESTEYVDSRFINDPEISKKGARRK